MGGRSGQVRERFTTILAPKNTQHRYTHRIMFGIPTLGQIRIEWANAFNGVVIPTNFSNSTHTPTGFRTADAQNLIAQHAIDTGFQWVLYIEDDVIVPPDLLLRLRPYCQHARYPMVSGLYFVKGNRREPMIYRGRGSGPYLHWKPGDRVWCDGVPTGCLLVHTRLLAEVGKVSESYEVRAGSKMMVRRIFEAPRMAWQEENGGYRKLIGTSDLYLCDRIRKERLLAKAGWKALQKQRHPFLVDTGIACGHIDRSTGAVFQG